uniref:Transmembrane protein n=1 Tax=Knipowitschia caucasica TaxID=637954 RepID=A0AAV2JUU6_KNICA
MRFTTSCSDCSDSLLCFKIVKMLSKVVGPKIISIAKSWIPTLAVWGTAGGVALMNKRKRFGGHGAYSCGHWTSCMDENN